MKKLRPPVDESVTLITGASSGIGREFARLLASRVKALVLVARRVERLEALASELRAANQDLVVCVKACDLGDSAALTRMVSEVQAEVGNVDVLVNNAGMGDMGLLDRSEWQKTDLMIRVNVSALSHLTHLLVKPMVERGRGGILNISSGFGLSFMPGFAAYAATKHYVTAYTESLRLELRDSGVVVSQVCPGPVATEFESLVGNPTGREVPAFIQISAEQCARAALRGFERDRALTVPGFWIKVALWLGGITPRPLYRLVMRPVAKELRRLPPSPS